MPIGKVWIYRLLFFVCFCLFVRLQISPARIKLAASNFARWFIGVQDQKCPILGNFALTEAPPEAPNRTNRRAAASIANRRQFSPLTARAWHALGMCGYTAVPEDGRTCYYIWRHAGCDFGRAKKTTDAGL